MRKTSGQRAPGGFSTGRRPATEKILATVPADLGRAMAEIAAWARSDAEVPTLAAERVSWLAEGTGSAIGAYLADLPERIFVLARYAETMADPSP